ncbi:MAG: YigZ family protein [Pseudomonadota bacterium]
MTSRDYRIPRSISQVTTEIKKSRFIAIISPAKNRKEALEVVQSLREKYPDAGHHCWAYIAGSPFQSSSTGMSDDGEPSGTAGKPILNVLSHKNIGDVVAVVVRYFGGIKLGAGGLVRAYSSAVQKAFDTLELESVTPQVHFKLIFDFAFENTIRHLLSQHDASILDTQYEQKIALTASCATSLLPLLEKAIQTATKGQGRLQPLNNH